MQQSLAGCYWPNFLARKITSIPESIAAKVLRVRSTTVAVNTVAKTPQYPSATIDGSTKENNSAPGRASSPRRKRPDRGKRDAKSNPPRRKE